jgi:branched-chain amino acid transport system ATP-binding protein
MTETILECHGLTKYFGALAAVKGVSFQVERGEIFGITGPNGAGKTTLFNLLSGHTPVSDGKIRFKQQELQSLPPHQICRRGLVRTFQIPHVFGGMTVAENVLVGSCFGRPARSVVLSVDSVARARAEEALTFTGLLPKAAWPAKLISVYERKLLMIASALAMNPHVLMLDEPFGGLNHLQIRELMDLIRRINEQGITILLIEHVMRALMALSSRVMVMHHGEKLLEGSPDEIMSDERVIQIYLGRRISVT